MKKLIKVTQEDINNGIPGNAWFCPVAHACARNNIIVGVVETTIRFKSNGKRIPAPESVKKFVKKFDKRKSVEPFNFLLDCSDYYLDFAQTV